MGESGTAHRTAFLDAAEAALALLREPAVAAAWDRPSALAKMSVGGLAAHLARQVLRVRELLESDPPAGEPIPLSEHFARSAWVTAGIDDEANVGIREQVERQAAAGPADHLARVEAAVRTLREVLPGQPADRIVVLPWTGWPLRLDDFLLTRMLEIAVHCDDLAVSVELTPPGLPAEVLDPVLGLLCQLAVRRHGATAVLRALSRSERAPVSISAF